jgi:hypothetical protein
MMQARPTVGKAETDQKVNAASLGPGNLDSGDRYKRYMARKAVYPTDRNRRRHASSNQDEHIDQHTWMGMREMER